MKKKKAAILKEVEKTMAYFDRLDKVEADPYFFTRLKTRLDTVNMPSRNLNGVLRPAWIILLILINLISVITLWSDGSDNDTIRSMYLQEVATDLTINQTYIDPFEQNN